MKKHTPGTSLAVLFGAVGLAWAAAQTTGTTTTNGSTTSAATTSPGTRMKTITNVQRKAAAAQARAQRVALRQSAKQAAKTRMTQPANAATVTANALANAATAPAVTASTTAGSNNKAAGVQGVTQTAAPLASAMTMASPMASTATAPIKPGQITDPSGNAILNQGLPIGIPGAAPSPNVCQPGILDYFHCGNYANSPLPEVQLDANGQPALDANGNMIPVPGTGIRKFVDTLAGVGAGNANNLNNYIPIATPGHATLADGTVDSKADYYEIELKRYT